MAERTSGIKFVAEGISQYLASLGKIAQKQSEVARSIAEIGQAWAKSSRETFTAAEKSNASLERSSTQLSKEAQSALLAASAHQKLAEVNARTEATANGVIVAFNAVSNSIKVALDEEIRFIAATAKTKDEMATLSAAARENAAAAINKLTAELTKASGIEGSFVDTLEQAKQAQNNYAAAQSAATAATNAQSSAEKTNEQATQKSSKAAKSKSQVQADATKQAANLNEQLNKNTEKLKATAQAQADSQNKTSKAFVGAKQSANQLINGMVAVLKKTASLERGTAALGQALAREERSMKSAGDVTSAQRRNFDNLARATISSGKATESYSDVSGKLATQLGKLGLGQLRIELAQEQTAKSAKVAERALTEQATAVIRANSAMQNATERTRQAEIRLEAEREKTKRTMAIMANRAAEYAKSHGPAAIAMKVLGNAASFAGGIIGGLFRKSLSIATSALKALLSPITNAVRKFSEFWTQVKRIAVGILIRDVIFGIARATKDVIREFSEWGKETQTLTIRLEGLLAREIRLKDETIGVARSLKLAQSGAANMVEQIQQLSLMAPFDVSNIANTQAFGMAMGFASGEAKKLTTAVLNYSAGMGLGSDVTERIIFNFGQMKASGKVTATEMRDLARGAFFPLNDVLREAGKMLGITAENFLDFRKQASEGKIDIDTFFKAFESVVSKDFPGAMERLGRTFTGAMQRAKNFLKVFIGGDILGPTITRIGIRLSEFLDNLASPEVRQKARVIGQVLLEGLERVAGAIRTSFLPAMRDLAKAIGLPEPSAKSFAESLSFISFAITRLVENASAGMRDLAKKINEGLGTTANNMFTWGVKFMVAFSKGLIQGLTFLVKAINIIAGVIASWFRPKSPPAIAPDLDKWGAEAMAIYLQGWTMADFSVFNQIAKKIEAFIRSLGAIGGGVPAILAARAAIIKAMNAFNRGAITMEQAIQRIRNSVTGLSSIFTRYIRLVMTVAQAQKAVDAATSRLAAAQKRYEAAQRRTRDAQEQLNKVTEKYRRIIEALQMELDHMVEAYDETSRMGEIDAALASGLLTDEERRRLLVERRSLELRAQIRSLEEQQAAEEATLKTVIDQLEAEEEAAQAKVEAAQAVLDAAQKQLEIYQKQLEIVESTIDLMIEQNNLMQELRGGAGGVNDELDETDNRLKSIVGTLIQLGGGKKWKMGVPLPFEAGASPTQKAEQEAALMFQRIEGRFNEFAQNASKALSDALGPSLTELGTQLDLLGQKFEKAFGGTEEKVFDPFRPILDSIVELAEKSAPLRAIFVLFWQMGESISSTWKEVASVWTENSDAMKILKGILNIVAVILGGAIVAAGWTVTTVLNILGKTISEVGKFFNYWIGQIRLTWYNMIRALVSFDFVRFFSEMLNLIGQVFVTAFGWILAVVWGFIQGIIQFFVDLCNTLVKKSIIPDMMNGMLKIITDVFTKIGEFFFEKIEAIKGFFTDLATKVGELIGGALTDLQNFLNTTFGGAIDAVKGKFDEWGAAVTTFWNEHIQPVIDWIKGDATKAITDFGKDALDKLVTFFTETIPDAVDTLWHDYFEPFWEWLSNDLWSGILDFIDQVLTPLEEGLTVIKEIVKKVWDMFEELWTSLRNNKIPDWLKALLPGSLPPLAQGLEWVAESTDVARKAFVSLESTFSGLDALSSNRVMAASPVSNSNTVNKTINIEVNPTYKNMQSEASLYYDISAALSAARI